MNEIQLLWTILVLLIAGIGWLATLIGFFEGKRSAAAQPGPPSASGSARALAVEQERAKSGSESPTNQLADSSDRSARESVRTVLEKWRKMETEAMQRAQEYANKALPMDAGTRDAEMLNRGAAISFHMCATDLETALSDAPPAAGERALARNDKAQRRAGR